MKIINKIISSLVCFSILLCGCNGTSEKNNETSNTAAEYIKGYGEGKNGTIHVEVMVKEGTIQHIEILEHNETPGFDTAMVKLSDEIIANNSTAVELIAGSTETCKGFISAINEALSSCDSKDFFKDDTEKTSTEYSCDILIVGGGGAGFAAAIEALSLGETSVTIIEKMPFGGGNTRMSGGEYAAPLNWVQTESGITNDSVELFFSDVYKGGYYKGKPELIKIICENATENAIWLRDYVGVKYKDYQSWYSGHSVPRTLWPVGDGPQYIDTLIKKANSLGVQVDYNTAAQSFIQDSSGHVIGVMAQNNDKPVKYLAKKGVILTTGGFGANVELRMKYDERWHKLDSHIPTTNSPAIMGDGIVMAKELGANLIGMGDIQLYPVNNPATGNYYFMDYARLISNALLINKDGERFVDEKETRDNIAEATIFQPNATVYEIIDSRVIEEMNLEKEYEEEFLRGIDQGVIFKGSLEECCKYFGLPLKNVEDTIKRYNNFAKNGVDEDFNRTVDLVPFKGEPYIMFSSVVSVHHTMGGVEIDTCARVLDTSGNVIPGLYAAGEVTGGIHGGNRLGSMSIPDTVAFGRIAARSIINGCN